MNKKELDRRYDLDWLRVLAVLAIFVFHCTRPFDTADWHIKNLITYHWVDGWKDFAMSWGMPLILLISGGSAFYALGKLSPGQYLKGLCARLLLPFTVGMFTHVAYQVYIENLDKGAFAGSFWQFYPHFFEGMYGFGGNFAWMGLHLWYLELLFILSLLFLPLFLFLRKTRAGKWILKTLGDGLALPGAVLLLAAPLVYLVVVLDPETWGNQSLGGWSVVIYPFFFLYGFVIVSSERLQARIRQMRWISLGLGIGLAAGYLFLMFQTSPSLRPLAHRLADPLSCLLGLSWLLVALGFGMQHLNTNHPLLKYANQACLPFYILHQPVVVTLGYYLVLRWEIPSWLKLVVLVSVSFVLITGLYEYGVRRWNVMRFLFGMKPLPRQPQPALLGQVTEAGQIK